MFTIRHRREADEPVIDQRVAALLDAATAPAEPGPAPGEDEALAAFRTFRQTAQSSRSRTLSSTPLRTAAAAVLGTGVLLTGGVTAAQAGSLPAPAQDAAQAVLAKIGISVPGGDEHGEGHAGPRDGSAESPRKSGGPEAGAPAQESSDRNGHGADVSNLARTTDQTGAEKGKAVSELASSDSRSHGGTAKAPGQPPGSSSADKHAQVTTPNTGGATRPSQPGGSANADGSGPVMGRSHAPDTSPSRNGGGAAPKTHRDASAFGRDTAATASGGHSSAGSDNAAAHRPDSPPSSRPSNPPGNRP